MKKFIKTSFYILTGLVCGGIVLWAIYSFIEDSINSALEDPTYIIIACIVLSGILMCFLIKKFREYYRQNEIYKLISWCVTEDSKVHRCNLNLEDCIWNAQIKLNLASKFRISKDDIIHVKTILKKFQQDTINKYFSNSDSFCIPKTKYVLYGEVYFLFLLHSYLDTCKSYDFMGYEILGAQLSHKDYDGNGYDATYNLTDFGIVFYKLLYITHIYCKNSKAINPEGKYYGNEKAIADIVESKTISVSCYRP